DDSIVIFALAHVFEALPDPPESVFCVVPVVRVITWPSTGMSDVAWTTVVPPWFDVIVTSQLADSPPPVYVQLLSALVGKNSPGPEKIDAVAVCWPESRFPLTAVTVIVST